MCLCELLILFNFLDFRTWNVLFKFYLIAFWGLGVLFLVFDRTDLLLSIWTRNTVIWHSSPYCFVRFWFVLGTDLLVIELALSTQILIWSISGIYIINLGKTWDKLQLAARVIVAIENPKDIIVQSARPYGQRAVLKFAQHTGANAIAGRHTPGTFTNQLQTSFNEPRLLILTDPRTDHQVTVNFHFWGPSTFLLRLLQQ